MNIKCLTVVILFILTYNMSIVNASIAHKEGRQEHTLIKLDEIRNQILELQTKIKTNERSHFQVYGPLYVGVLALIGAVSVAIYTTSKQLKIARGQAVSNFRVKWLDDFRNLIAELQASLDNIAYKPGPFNDAKLSDDPDYVKARFLRNKLHLMLNGTSDENKAFIAFTDDYIDNFLRYYQNDEEKVQYSVINEQRNQLFAITEQKLQKAWDKATRLDPSN